MTYVLHSLEVLVAEFVYVVRLDAQQLLCELGEYLLEAVWYEESSSLPRHI